MYGMPALIWSREWFSSITTSTFDTGLARAAGLDAVLGLVVEVLSRLGAAVDADVSLPQAARVGRSSSTRSRGGRRIQSA